MGLFCGPCRLLVPLACGLHILFDPFCCVAHPSFTHTIVFSGVVCDVHGDFFGLNGGFDTLSVVAELEAGHTVVINADLGDRGRDQGLVLLQLMLLKVLYPDNLFIIMGNHEVRQKGNSAAV